MTSANPSEMHEILTRCITQLGVSACPYVSARVCEGRGLKIRFPLGSVGSSTTSGIRSGGVFLIEGDLPCGTVDGDPLCGSDASGGVWHANDGRHAVRSPVIEG